MGGGGMPSFTGTGVNIWDPPDFNPGIPPGEASNFAVRLLSVSILAPRFLL